MSDRDENFRNFGSPSPLGYNCDLRKTKGNISNLVSTSAALTIRFPELMPKDNASYQVIHRGTFQRLPNASRVSANVDVRRIS
ncbi:hypothetical protein RRSWK_07157 [Rhodopirellula sp. SWK7]|nr:hypothetical protein RRSWK_07157 [Rhodopirellula sp. SWK7]